MKRLKPASIARAVGALALAAALLPASAAVVQFDFVATVEAGPFAGQVGTGLIRFDDAFQNSNVTPLAGGLEIDFSFRGQTFDETHDVDFPGLPQVSVVDGLPVFIDFLLVQGESNVDFADEEIALVALQGLLLPGTTSRLVTSIVVELDDPGVVPEPATFGLAGLALLGLAMGRRRKTSL